MHLRDNKPGLRFANMWDFPGGGREGEETPVECAVREIQEEMGITLTQSQFIWQKEYPSMQDVQPGILARLPNQTEYLAKITAAVDAAHEHKVLVIYIVVGFRPGMPEASSNNKTFGNIPKEMEALMVNPQPAMMPTDEDVVVTKRRVSAFSGSDLEVVLRAKGIRHLVLAGIATSGVVLSTIREAADKDYELTVLSDLCLDFDEEVHSVLMTKVFPRQASVTTSEEWSKGN